VHRGTVRPNITYPVSEVLEFDADTFGLGRGEMEAAPGEMISLYGPARSVVDAIRLRRRTGEQVAFRALRTFLGRRGVSPVELISIARALGVEGPVLHAVQAVS
jgi:hypothetical protein